VRPVAGHLVGDRDVAVTRVAGAGCAHRAISVSGRSGAARSCSSSPCRP
jgi:hypothetical protein